MRTSRKYAPGLSSPSHPITRCPLTALPEQLPSHLLPSPPRKSGEGEGAGGHLCTMEPPLPSAMFPTKHPPNDSDPNSHVPATQICEIWQTDLLHMSGCSPARRAENSISPWQYLAVAGRTSPCLKLPKDTLATLHKIRYLRSILRFNQNSKSVDFRLSSPGFLTRSPTLLTFLVRTVPRPWFNCSVRPRLVPSSECVQCFFVWTLDCSRFTPSLRRPSSATSYPISKQRMVSANQSVASQRRLAPTIPLRGSFWACSVTDPQPEIPKFDQMRWVL